MIGKSILLQSPDKVAARRLAVFLRASGNEVHVVDSVSAAADLVSASAIDLVLIDYRSTPELDKLVSVADGRVPIVALSARPNPSVLVDLVCDRKVDHLLVSNHSDDKPLQGLDAREVVTTCEKILRCEFFGIDKYLNGYGLETTTIEVHAATDRDDVVDCLQDYLNWLGASREVRAAMALVVDELVTNAVYNAPRDVHGRARYSSLDRRQKVSLTPSEYVNVQFGSDGNVFALSVSDQFGALAPDRIRSGLRRCYTEDDQIEQKAGGAGLGLYTVLNSCDRLVINLEPEQKTEVIAISKLSRRNSRGRRGSHSLHLFTGSKPVAANIAQAIPHSVMVSDSMRIQLCNALAPSKRASTVVPLVKRKPTAPQPVAQAEPDKPTPATAPLARTSRDLSGAGFDTVLGLVRGATKTNVAFETCLRFLASCHRSSVACKITGGVIKPWLCAGEIYNWSELSATELAIDASSSIAVLVRDRAIAMFSPEASSDRKLSTLAVGHNQAEVTVLPITVSCAPRFVLLGFSPRNHQRLTPGAFSLLRNELEGVLDRHELNSARAAVSALSMSIH